MLGQALNHRRGPSVLAVVLATAFTAGLLPSGVATAKICWSYSVEDASNPQPWITACEAGEDPDVDFCYDEATDPFNCSLQDSDFAEGSTVGQTIAAEHRNWHCINHVPRPSAPSAEKEEWGRKFLAFHRQFVLDYDIWRLDGFPGARLEIWDPLQNAPVPGSDETTATDFPNVGGGLLCQTGVGRGIAEPCAGCLSLDSKFTIGGGLQTNFDNLGAVGYALEVDPDPPNPPNEWHASWHIGVADLGCEDLASGFFTPFDPVFWLGHNKLDEVARAWMSQQATDLVIVFDRSGSMNDNCPGGSEDPGETPCAINDAREAAKGFVDTVRDDVATGGEHRIGLVSFSDTADNELPGVNLVAAEDIVTDNAVDDTDFEIALSGIAAGGATSIAAGVREAISVLSAVADPNPHQAILVLTDGRENTAPCLDATDEGLSEDCISAVAGEQLEPEELGDIQVVAIAFGDGALEANLRDLTENHAGSFLAQDNRCSDDPSEVCLTDADCGGGNTCEISALSLQKFFLSSFGLLFDEGVIADPVGSIGADVAATEAFEIPVCGDQGLTVAAGWDPVRGAAGETTALAGVRFCDLRLELFTPSGAPVERSDPGVEAGHGSRHDFMRVNLPYKGESAGTWKGRLVRPAGQSCRLRQDYFYAVLGRGATRVDPWVVQPNVVVGQPILATFRIGEPYRPRDGFDNVVAEATLTRPDRSSETLPLYDDGTHGDAIIGNHLFSVAFPDPADRPGTYQVHGRFELTENGCTEVREASYSLIVPEQPQRCIHPLLRERLGSAKWDRAQPGDTFVPDHLICVRNACASEDRYTVEIRDSLGWLKVKDPGTGALSDPPASFQTAAVRPFAKACDLADGLNLVAVIPEGARPGDRSVVSVRLVSLNNPDEAPVELESSIEAYPPRDCNKNGIDDREDLGSGTSKDENADGIPDECWDYPPPHLQMAGVGHEEPGEEDGEARPGCVIGALLVLLLLLLIWVLWRRRKSSP